MIKYPIKRDFNVTAGLMCKNMPCHSRVGGNLDPRMREDDNDASLRAKRGTVGHCERSVAIFL